MWDNLDKLIPLRDELRDHLMAYQDEPTGDNLARVQHTLADMHTNLTNLHDKLQVQPAEAPSLDATGFIQHLHHAGFNAKPNITERRAMREALIKHVIDMLAGSVLDQDQVDRLVQAVLSRAIRQDRYALSRTIVVKKVHDAVVATELTPNQVKYMVELIQSRVRKPRPLPEPDWDNDRGKVRGRGNTGE